jgi:hypothetical protein
MPLMPETGNSTDMTHCQECYSFVHPECTRECNGATLCLSCRHTLVIQQYYQIKDSSSDTYKQSDNLTTDIHSMSNSDKEDDDIELLLKTKSKTKQSNAELPTNKRQQGHPTIESGEESEDNGKTTAKTRKTTSPKTTQEPKAAVTTPEKELRPLAGRQISLRFRKSPATNTQKSNKL